MAQEIEGPNESIFKPKGAEKMPTKHYPDTTKIGTKGPKVDIEGPCKEEKGYHK